MATRANLIATYNANPTLQKQYTLAQYLALFDFGQTPTTPTPTPTPTPVTPGIPNIINQNINQGGGGDGGPQGIATNYGTYGKEYTGMTMPDGTPIGSMTKQKGPGFIEGLLSIPGQLMETYKQFSPLGFIGRQIEANKVAKQKTINDAIAKAEAARKIREAEAQAAALSNAQRTGRRPGSGGPGIATDDTGVSYDAGGREGFGYGLADGGRVYLYHRLK